MLAEALTSARRQPAKYRGQDFEALRSECLSRGQLFSDPAFPAAPESLGYSQLGPTSEKSRGVEWKRPGEVCSKPQFIVGGATRSDIHQGHLGDYWLLEAIASLTLDQKILARVINPEQSFTKNYAGIFHFQLWQYGQWVDVVVDDKLPTKDGELLFLHLAEREEFWCALLEKAYAKVNGSYEALKGGWAGEGFEDFTGGMVECHQLSKAPANLFSIMKQALSRGSLLSTSITASAGETETVTKERLVKRHAHFITAAEEVNAGGHFVHLVRLRNPWGHKEWGGAWSDKSKEWDRVLPQVKAKLNHCQDHGEFWMAYSDFKQQYSKVEICNLIPDTPSLSHHWDFWQFEAAFRSNRQFVVNLGITGHSGVNICSLLVGLMQKDVWKQKHTSRDFSSICFAIYAVPNQVCTVQYKGRKSVHLSSETLSRMSAVFRSELFPRREVCGRLSLPPGEYVIVPSTYEPNEEGRFLLRVFHEQSPGPRFC